MAKIAAAELSGWKICANGITIGESRGGNEMKVTCLNGSPRENGNSTLIAKRFCDTAINLVAEVKTFALNKLDYRGCQGCYACKTKFDRCVLKDDLSEVLEAVRETDILVLASPVYFWDVTAQMKGFLDRCFSFLVPDFHTNPKRSRLAPGKKLVFILTQNNLDQNSFTHIFEKFDYFFRGFGFTDTRQIRAFGAREPGAVASDPELMGLAAKTAEELCPGSH
ncbi:MAG: flavodoxin family protein [Syntrophobacteraceae bacterium]|nr:flavodoxin family protein [Syntrophobacteraceae bacterium]